MRPWCVVVQHRNNWHKASFNRRLLPKQHTAAIFCLAFDDEHIVTGSSDHSVRVWDTTSGEPLRTLTGHQYAVWNLKVFDQLFIIITFMSLAHTFTLMNS
jgi:WD40 repeat protein